MIATLLLYGLVHVHMISIPSGILNGVAIVCIVEKVHDNIGED
jgi:hypothetical protein